MPHFKRKQFKIEAQQVTEENISDVYNWVNSSNNSAVADSLTANSFSVNNGGRTVPVNVGSWVVDYHTGAIRIVVLKDEDFHERFELLGEGDESLPYIFTTTIPQ